MRNENSFPFADTAPSTFSSIKERTSSSEIISKEDAMFETMMLGLRTMEGVSQERFEKMHGLSLQKVYGEKLQKPLREKLVQWENGYVKLTETGLSLQNRVLVELM